MDGNGVHKTLYPNLEIHGPWKMDLCPRSGQIWSYTENVFNLKKYYVYPQQEDKS